MAASMAVSLDAGVAGEAMTRRVNASSHVMSPVGMASPRVLYSQS